MPSRLIIISDMEFDSCTNDADMTNFESAKAKFERAGYKLPSLVFWNVNSFNRQQPVRRFLAAGRILLTNMQLRDTVRI